MTTNVERFGQSVGVNIDPQKDLLKRRIEAGVHTAAITSIAIYAMYAIAKLALVAGAAAGIASGVGIAVIGLGLIAYLVYRVVAHRRDSKAAIEMQRLVDKDSNPQPKKSGWVSWLLGYDKTKKSRAF